MLLPKEPSTKNINNFFPPWPRVLPVPFIPINFQLLISKYTGLNGPFGILRGAKTITFKPVVPAVVAVHTTHSNIVSQSFNTFSSLNAGFRDTTGR